MYRFQARSVLRTAGQPVPMDNPGGVYAFKAKFVWAKRIYRTIELRSEQTLDDLHYAIQRAIKWDADCRDTRRRGDRLEPPSIHRHFTARLGVAKGDTGCRCRRDWGENGAVDHTG